MTAAANEITVAVDAHGARHASEWLETVCHQHDVPQPELDRLAICLEEVLMNIIDHGGSTARSEPIRLQFQAAPHANGDPAVTLTVSDAGEAFDPLSGALASAPKTLDEALPGGMGLRMIRQCSHSLNYRREAGRNHLTFGTHWSKDSK